MRNKLIRDKASNKALRQIKRSKKLSKNIESLINKVIEDRNALFEKYKRASQYR